MTTGKALNGKPYAGNPHVRFDEGEVASVAMPRRGSLLYNRMMTIIAGGLVLSASVNAHAGVNLIQNGDFDSSPYTGNRASVAEGASFGTAWKVLRALNVNLVRGTAAQAISPKSRG